MKHFSIATQTLLASLLLPTSLQAIEAPEDNAPPPAQATAPAVPAQPAAPAAAPTAFLGLITQPVPDILREHLNLGDQQGVLVASVIPDGPAAKAGLHAHDIITGIDDKKITSPEELSTLITGHKPGDEIRISIIQKGKPSDQKATLSERPIHIPMARREQLEEMPALEGLPDELADRIRRMVEENAGGAEIPFAQPGEIVPNPDADAAIDKIRKQMENAMQGQMKFELGLNGEGLNIQRGATFRMMDNNGSIEMKSEDEAKEVTIRDKDNNIIWNGPWDTEQDKAAAPADIRERIERFNIGGNGRELRLNVRPR